ncbi:MAG: hypothetical protein Q4C50_11445 [Eubacteriales bacterium]|nr:hypothetical protein [Eubacteriales bacterium]
MIRAIIETNALLYAIAAVGMLGILCQFIISRRYGQLIREASDMQMEKKDFMKQLRYRYSTNRKRSNENVNISVFVRRYLMDYRYMRMNLHQWKRLAAGLFLVSMVSAGAGITYCFRAELPAVYLQNILWTAAGAAVCTGLTWLWTDMPYKASYLHTELEDYLHCFGAGKDYQEAEAAETEKTRFRAPAVIGMRKKDAASAETKAQRDKRELKANLAKIKEGSREAAADSEQRERSRELLRQMDSQEQERIIRDVLAEFLA